MENILTIIIIQKYSQFFSIITSFFVENPLFRMTTFCEALSCIQAVCIELFIFLSCSIKFLRWLTRKTIKQHNINNKLKNKEQEKHKLKWNVKTRRKKQTDYKYSNHKALQSPQSHCADLTRSQSERGICLVVQLLMFSAPSFCIQSFL